MNTTQINWNTEKPKFEEVEGKQVIVKWMCAGSEEVDGCISTGFGFYEAYFDNNFLAYAILTEEPKYCEWTIRENDFRSECGIVFESAHKYCGHCGKPIKIIEELKPKEYKGKLPKIIETPGYYVADWCIPGEIHQFDAETKDAVIKKWNDFVEGK